MSVATFEQFMTMNESQYVAKYGTSCAITAARNYRSYKRQYDRVVDLLKQGKRDEFISAARQMSMLPHQIDQLIVDNGGCPQL